MTKSNSRPMEQLGLDLARKGMARATAASPSVAPAVISRITAMPRGTEFTADVFVDLPGNRVALGPAIRKAATRRLIEDTGRWEKSAVPSNQARRVGVWRRL